VNWKPMEDVDAEIRRWMKSKGWDVTGVDYDPQREIYTWSARSVRSGHSPALSISRQVFADFPAFAILEHLDRLEVAAAIRRRPDSQYVLVQKGAAVTLQKAIGS
jgi:hypothetical protein